MGLTFFHLGSLTIPAVWVAATLAIVLAALLNKLLVKSNIADWYWNSFFLYVLVWKLSYIIFNFKMFLDLPSSVLYFNGGTKGHLLALTILSIYLLFFAVKKYPTIYEESAPSFLLYFICYEIIINSLESGFNEGFGHLILLLAFLFFLNSYKKKQHKLSIQMYLFMLLIELLILSFFNTLFSLETLTFIWLGIIVLSLSIKPARRIRT